MWPPFGVEVRLKNTGIDLEIADCATQMDKLYVHNDSVYHRFACFVSQKKPGQSRRIVLKHYNYIF
jgi:hypothetical protein